MKKLIHRQLFSLFFFLTAIGLLVFLNGQNYLEAPKNLTASFFQPFQKIAQGFSNRINYYFDIAGSIGALKEDNLKFKEENEKLLAENSKLKEVRRENDFLRKQLEIPQSKNLDLALADVIGREPENFGSYIIISAGKKQGIRKKQAVITAGGILIGQISETFDNFSKVVLLTDSRSSVNATTQQTRTIGSVKGKYGISVLMEMVSQDEKIEVGEIVITSGAGEEVPKGLVIGKVKSVEESNSEIFKKIILETPVDFRKIERVFVVTE